MYGFVSVHRFSLSIVLLFIHTVGAARALVNITIQVRVELVSLTASFSAVLGYSIPIANGYLPYK